MEKKWTLRDTFFALIGVTQVVLLFVVVMAMVQRDHQYDRMNTVIDEAESARRTINKFESLTARWQRIIATLSPGSQPTTLPIAIADPDYKDEGDWLVMASTEPQKLNPLTSSDAYASIIQGYILHSLLERDNNVPTKFIPSLATRWEISEDKLTYTFWLDKRARWADDTPVTADDVVFTYETIMNPTVECAHGRVYYVDVKECRKLDDHTVQFVYKKRYWRALSVLGGLQAIPRHFYETQELEQYRGDPKKYKEEFSKAFNKRNRDLLGNGPYKLGKWETGKQVIVERDQGYWRLEKRPYLDRIVFRIIQEPQARLQALQSGAIDRTGLSPDQWKKQTAKTSFTDRFRKDKWLANGYNYIGWNLRKKWFQDRRVRRALTHLTPRTLIRDKVYKGLAKIATGNFNAKTPAHDKSIQPYAHDPNEAARLLDEAGWKDTDGDGIRDKDGLAFKFELMLPSGSDTSRQIGSLVRQHYQQAGIEVSVKQVEWAVFLQFIDKREFDACCLGWSMGLEADPYQIWHSSVADKERSSNFVGFKNAECDKIIEDARVCFDEEKRNKMFHRFHQIMHEEQPYTFLMVRYALVAVDKRYQDVRVYPMGYDTYEWFVPLDSQKW